MERKGATFLDPKVPVIGKRFALGGQRDLVAKPGLKSVTPWKGDCDPLNLVLIKSMIQRPADYTPDQVRKQFLTCIHEQLLNVRKAVKDLPPDMLCYAAVALANTFPSIVKHPYVLAALTEFMRPDAAGGVGLSQSSVAASSMKTKAPLQDVYVAEAIRILSAALEQEKEWPREVLKMYVRDAATDRTWVDYEPFRPFVAKIESAFNTTNVDMGAAGAEEGTSTTISTKDQQLQVPVNVFKTEGAHSSAPGSLSGEDTMSTADSGDEDVIMGNVDTTEPFSYIPHAEIGKMCIEWLNEFVSNRKSYSTVIDTSNRNIIRFLITAAGVAKLREYAMPKLDNWLTSPNVAGIAKRLVAVICANISVDTIDADLQRVSELCNMRVKSKMMSEHFVKCYKLCITANAANLNALMQCTVRNEVELVSGRQSALFVPVLFSHDRERCSKLLAQYLCGAAGRLDKSVEYKRGLSGRLRELIICARGSFDVQVFIEECRQAWNARKEVNNNEPVSANYSVGSSSTSEDSDERLVIGLFIEFINVALELQRNMLVRSLPASPDATNTPAAVAKINRFADFIRAMHENLIKLLFSKQHGSVYTPQYRVQCLLTAFGLMTPANVAEQEYFTLPNSQVADKIAAAADVASGSSVGRAAIALRLLPQVELVQVLLDFYVNSTARIISAEELLTLMDNITMRTIGITMHQRLNVAASTANYMPTSMPLDVRIVELLLRLCQYELPATIALPKNLKSIMLYKTKLYWRVNMLLFVLSCYAPHTIGRLCWREQPNVRVLMEMAIVNQFTFPPPTMMNTSPNSSAGNNEARLNETRQREEDVKVISDMQARVVRVRDRGGLEQSEVDRMPHNLMRKPADGVIREPSADMLRKLEDINKQNHMGRCLCQSRSPDFLKDIIDTKGTSSCVTWLLKLMEESDSTYRVMPVECICELLCHELTKPAGSSDAGDAAATASGNTAAASAAKDAEVKLTGAEAYYSCLEFNAKRCIQLLSRINNLIATSSASSATVSENDNGLKILNFFGSRLYSPSFETRQAARAALYALKDVKLLRNTSKFQQLQQYKQSKLHDNNNNNAMFPSCFTPSTGAISRPPPTTAQTPASRPPPPDASPTFDVNQRTSIISSMLKAAARDFSPATGGDKPLKSCVDLASMFQQSLLLSAASGRQILATSANAEKQHHQRNSSRSIVALSHAEDKFLVQLNLDDFKVNAADADGNGSSAFHRSFAGFLAQALRVETEPQVIMSYIEWLAAPHMLLLLQQNLPENSSNTEQYSVVGVSLESVVASLTHLLNRRQLICEMLLYKRDFSDRVYTSAAKILLMYLAGEVVPEYGGSEAQAALEVLKRAKVC